MPSLDITIQRLGGGVWIAYLAQGQIVLESRERGSVHTHNVPTKFDQGWMYELLVNNTKRIIRSEGGVVVFESIGM